MYALCAADYACNLTLSVFGAHDGRVLKTLKLSEKPVTWNTAFVGDDRSTLGNAVCWSPCTNFLAIHLWTRVCVWDWQGGRIVAQTDGWLAS